MQQIQRKSYNTTNKIYFFTATIHKWLPLLAEDNNQQLIIDYLKKLCDDGFLTVYAFVLMPNHVHITWQQNKLNGKEKVTCDISDDGTVTIDNKVWGKLIPETGGESTRGFITEPPMIVAYNRLDGRIFLRQSQFGLTTLPSEQI